MKRVTVILTCYNRCERTIECIKTLKEGNPKVSLSFVVVDDNSADDTKNKIYQLINCGYDVVYIMGNGCLYWAGGMRVGIEYALNNTDSDYYLFVNDDVKFEYSVIQDMIDEYEEKRYKNCKALVGATYGENGMLSYGGVNYLGRGVQHEIKGPDYRGKCDTFCMNCVFIDNNVFFKCGNFDSEYIHSLADYDYGLNISREIGCIYMFSRFVGKCDENSILGTWQDPSLSIFKRLVLKEEEKGAPFGPWFHFLNKNFGLIKALIHSVKPYFRVILGK